MKPLEAFYAVHSSYILCLEPPLLGLYNIYMSTAAIDNRAAISEIKRLYATGVITRRQAQTLAAPVITLINEHGEEVARKWGKKHAPQTFIGLMR